LKPGMTVGVTMTAKTVKDALVVPTPAVFKNNEGADYVVVAAPDGHAHLKTIQVGVRSAEFSQVLSGVTAGEAVISSGGYALPDNTQVKIEAPAAGEKDAGDKPGKEEKEDQASEAKPAKKGKE
jgi:multidrug efflux pump subunit AcrA (membrane-fusion protein)